MTEVKIKLNEAIQAHGEKIDELTLRRPNGGDIRKCGFPINGDKSINTEAVAEYISLLAAIPTSAVDALSAGDWMAAMTEVVNFFGVSPTTS